MLPEPQFGDHEDDDEIGESEDNEEEVEPVASLFGNFQCLPV
jgi:hypothetical protein